MELKPCHSANARNPRIFYKAQNPECVQCSQREGCAAAAQKRINAANQSTRVSYAGQYTSQPAPQQQYQQQQTYRHSNGAMLQFNPMPEKYEDGYEESPIARTMMNAVQAGSAAALDEVVHMIRNYRVPVKRRRKKRR